MISFGQTEPSSLCRSKRYRRQTPIPTLEGGAWNLGRRLLPIWGVMLRPSAAGSGARDCQSIASSTASSGPFTPTRRNSMPGGTAGLGQQPMSQAQLEPWRALGKGYGGVRGVGAQVIGAATDEHLWSEAYDRELGDGIALESEVAQAIAGRVQVTVTGAERARLVAARQVSPDVYENFLKGQFVEKSNSPAA